MKLQPYNPEAACQKCGYTMVITRHLGAISWARYNPEKRPEQECLLRSCDRCRFVWYEQCATPAPAEPPVRTTQCRRCPTPTPIGEPCPVCGDVTLHADYDDEPAEPPGQSGEE